MIMQLSALTEEHNLNLAKMVHFPLGILISSVKGSEQEIPSANLQINISLIFPFLTQRVFSFEAGLVYLLHSHFC